MLHDRDAASPFNLPHAGCSIIKFAGQYNTRYPVTVGLGCRAKSYIDAGALMLLFRPHADMDVVLLHEQVMIRPCNIDLADLDGFSIPRMNGRKPAGTTENSWKKTLRSRR